MRKLKLELCSIFLTVAGLSFASGMLILTRGINMERFEDILIVRVSY